MPSECGAVNPEIPGVSCNKEKHEGNSHTFKYNTGEVNWISQPKEAKPLSREQIEQVIGDHKIKLQQTLDEVKSSSNLGADLINTLIPPMQTQLFLIEEILKLVKE